MASGILSDSRFQIPHSRFQAAVGLLWSRRVAAVLLALLAALCMAGAVVPRGILAIPFAALAGLVGLSASACVVTRAYRLIHSALRIPHSALLGSLLFHAGLVGLTAAGALSTLTREEGKLLLTEGQETNLATAAGVRLRLEKFHPVHVGSWGTPDYASDLAVIEEGQEARRATVRVNEPLVHRGLTLYQALHGFSVLVVLADAQGRPRAGSWVALGTDLKSQPVRYRDTFTLPGTRLAVEAEFFPDAFPEGDKLTTRSPDPRNPALAATVRDGLDTLYRGPVYLEKPVQLRDGLWLKLAGVRYWSGFDTVRDRGVGLLFASAWAAVAGLCLRFWPKRRPAV
ncbi:MAG: cytochrome c biogenesis protein ResB [Planctomycetes bacterium]|nr:cytochrome c biogenesis protein ResB [Planctomycetota bacterium]